MLINKEKVLGLPAKCTEIHTSMYKKKEWERWEN